MFLKRLEVIGFKSFADRIGIDFVPGVTAVVGPNGSGKSNVTDAIRWVLGEQSAKSLRGAKMEDVIFAGSDSRKPLNFAEVSLILDNTDQRIALDYNEISVTRRVFRSGDSEYLLNKQTCRLKDITDLFMDSGLGKEAFSIISQGRVDEILNSKPEDRRSIFEEAAGVLKYKLRKKKAESKLFETDDNLNRVLDILHELNDRMEPLQMQASKAKDFVEMTGQLKDVELSVLAFDYQIMQDKEQQLKNQLDEQTTKKLQLADEIEALEKALLQDRIELTSQDTTLDEAQTLLVEASSELERWEGRKLLQEEKNTNAAAQVEKLQAEMAEVDEQLKEIAQSMQMIEEQKQLKQQQLKDVQTSIKLLEQQMGKSSEEVEREIDERKSYYIDLLNEEATLKNEVKNIVQQQNSQQEQQSKVTGEESVVQQEMADLQKRQQNITVDLSEIRTQLKEKREQYISQNQSFEETKAIFDNKQTVLFEAYQHVQQLKAKRDSLSALEAEFSGFFQGVKEILQARDKGQLKGVVGAVAELIQVDATYTKAIEIALGGALQHIVTKNDHDAREAINHLKQRRMGRATFLPLTVMQSRKLPQDVIRTIQDHPSFVQTADSLVKYEEENATIIENLLGNVIVAKDLEGASKIAKSLSYRYRVVSLDGDIVNAGGSLTGGAMKQQSSVFSRKAELEQLIDQVKTLEAQLQDAETQVSIWKQKVATASEQVEQLKEQGEQLRSKEMEFDLSLRQVEEQLNRLTDRLFISQSENKSMEERHEQLLHRQTEAETRLQQISLQIKEEDAQITRLTKLKNEGQQERDRLTEQSAEMRSKLAVLTEQVRAYETQLHNVKLTETKATDKRLQIEKEIVWITTGEGKSGPTKEEMEQALAKWAATKEHASSVVATSKEARNQIQLQMQQKELQLKQHNHVYQDLLDTIRKIDVQLNRLDVEHEALVEHLYDTYHMDMSELRIPEQEDFDLVTARKKVKLLKQSIEELGPVNVSAIEEFDKVSERHAFLSEQREDLLSAKETLHAAIKEMDEEMTVRFRDAFFAIRTQFSRVFRELFGGGHADLILTNPDDLLETGIEIVAQPPGKKMQALSLLSGGERALTAIALLFSILHTRPVPFCILDEVEAALDEANVVRYSNYIRKFSNNTQFIVITHRKGTMEGADVLYGITMQESGISKLVSVKLQDETTLIPQGSASQ